MIMQTSLSSMFTQFLNRPGISKDTHDKYYYRLRGFVALHANEAPGTIATPMLLSFIESKPYLSDPSRSIYRQCFHAFFAFCGLHEDNPAKSLPRWRDTPRRIVLPNEPSVKLALAQAISMCHSANPVDVRDGLIFTLAVMSGNRRGEIRNLKVLDLIDAMQHPEDNGVYRAYTTGKTGESIMRFVDSHIAHFRYYLRLRPLKSEHVFVNLDKASQGYGGKLSLVTFDRIRPKVCKRAGVDVITYQELRRRLATSIARSVNVDTAAQVLNHSPHSGDRVIRLFYYDPDKAAADKAAAAVFGGIGA